MASNSNRSSCPQACWHSPACHTCRLTFSRVLVTPTIMTLGNSNPRGLGRIHTQGYSTALIKHFSSEFAPSVAREHDWTKRRLLACDQIMGLPLEVSLVSAVSLSASRKRLLHRNRKVSCRQVLLWVSLWSESVLTPSSYRRSNVVKQTERLDVVCPGD